MRRVTLRETAALPARVARAARAQGLLAPGTSVLVAVSGGSDSTALATLLAEGAAHGLPLRLVLAHVDHGWRGPAEAAADRAQVATLADRLRLPLVVSPPPPQELPRTEDGARQWRYRWLARTARENACTHVATGHHAGDQAETFLMRLLRGSGLVGLAGIPAIRPLGPHGLQVVRPLLEVEPADLRAWLVARGLSWREDATNADLARDRARIRARLAARAAPGAVPTLAALARRLRRRVQAREAALAARAGAAFCHHPWAGAIEMPRATLAGLEGEDLALMLRLAGRSLRADADGPWFTRRHVRRIAALLGDGGDLDLPRGLLLHVGGRRVWLARRERPRLPPPRLAVERVPAGRFDLAAHLATRRDDEAALDADLLGAAPAVRLLRPEDRFCPQGRGGEGPVRVGAWLARRGIPRLARRGQLVVVGASGVAWVVGRRVDRRHLVTPATRTVARVRLVAKEAARA